MVAGFKGIIFKGFRMARKTKKTPEDNTPIVEETPVKETPAKETDNKPVSQVKEEATESTPVPPKPAEPQLIYLLTGKTATTIYSRALDVASLLDIVDDFLKNVIPAVSSTTPVESVKQKLMAIHTDVLHTYGVPAEAVKLDKLPISIINLVLSSYGLKIVPIKR